MGVFVCVSYLNVCVCFVLECCVNVFVGCVCELMRDVVWFVFFFVLLMCVAD